MFDMKKKILITALIVLLVTIEVSGCLQITTNRKESINNLYLSPDGKILKCRTVKVIYNFSKHDNDFVFSELFWYTNNGTIIQNESLKNKLDDQFFSGRIYSKNHLFFIKTNNNYNIIFYNATDGNFTKELPINGRIYHVSISPDSTLLAVDHETFNLSIIDSSKGNTSLWNIPSSNLDSFSWSKDGKTIQLLQWIGNFTTQKYNLTIRNATNGAVLQSYELQTGRASIIASIYGEYVIQDIDKKTLTFYNLSGLERTLHNINSIVVSILWSDDGTTLLIALEDQEVIEIRNASTGNLITSFETPMYASKEPFRLDPFYCYIVIPIVALVLFLTIVTVISIIIQNRRKKH
jgi:hypothetical protein